MGVIAPTAWICLLQLKKRSAMGYILLELLLTVCSIIGIMLPIQTAFQLMAGISLPIGAIVTKVAIFIMCFSVKEDYLISGWWAIGYIYEYKNIYIVMEEKI